MAAADVSQCVIFCHQFDVNACKFCQWSLFVKCINISLDLTCIGRSNLGSVLVLQ